MQLLLQSQIVYYDFTDSFFASFMAFFLGILVFVVILAIIAYILSAIIFYNTANTNGFQEFAVLSWIPFANIYVLFALGSKQTSLPEVKAEALKFTLIFYGLFIASYIPLLGFLASIAIAVLGIYYSYRLFYRWTGDQGQSILFVVLMYITAGIFFFVYGMIKMKERFVTL